LISFLWILAIAAGLLCRGATPARAAEPACIHLVGDASILMGDSFTFWHGRNSEAKASAEREPAFAWANPLPFG